MEKEIGKMYVSRHTETRKGLTFEFECVILCTGPGNTDYAYEPMAGVVVKNTDKSSNHRVGNHSESWNFRRFTEEYVGFIAIDNKDWVDRKECGDVCG